MRPITAVQDAQHNLDFVVRCVAQGRLNSRLAIEVPPLTLCSPRLETSPRLTWLAEAAFVTTCTNGESSEEGNGDLSAIISHAAVLDVRVDRLYGALAAHCHGSRKVAIVGSHPGYCRCLVHPHANARRGERTNKALSD